MRIISGAFWVPGKQLIQVPGPWEAMALVEMGAYSSPAPDEMGSEPLKRWHLWTSVEDVAMILTIPENPETQIPPF